MEVGVAESRQAEAPSVEVDEAARQGAAAGQAVELVGGSRG